jgi:cytochrome oxidase assembly protein ShyY1
VRFLLSRRWILFAIAVVLMAYGAVRLGEWQFHRLEERKASNAIVRHNLVADPLPAAKVLEPGQPVSEQHEWRQISATGRYVPEQTVLVRYQTRDGASGVDVVTPLLTSSGTALLVNRGWLATDNSGSTDPDVPAPPSGIVHLTGWVRQDAEDDDATRVTDHSTRAISSKRIAALLPFPVYGGFVELEHQTPEAAQPLVRADQPDLSNGPHFFYGLQWWFFGALAVFGFCYLAWDERRKRLRVRSAAGSAAGSATGPASAQSERSAPPSTGSIAPETYDAAGESRKAAARPNSSGRP